MIGQTASSLSTELLRPPSSVIADMRAGARYPSHDTRIFRHLSRELEITVPTGRIPHVAPHVRWRFAVHLCKAMASKAIEQMPTQ